MASDDAPWVTGTVLRVDRGAGMEPRRTPVASTTRRGDA